MGVGNTCSQPAAHSCFSAASQPQMICFIRGGSCLLPAHSLAALVGRRPSTDRAPSPLPAVCGGSRGREAGGTTWSVGSGFWKEQAPGLAPGGLWAVECPGRCLVEPCLLAASAQPCHGWSSLASGILRTGRAQSCHPGGASLPAGPQQTPGRPRPHLPQGRRCPPGQRTCGAGWA